MKGVKYNLTTPWQMWPDPLLEEDWTSVAGIHACEEKLPNGHNAIQMTWANGRNTSVFSKYTFPVYSDHKYLLRVTAKRIVGNGILVMGFWDLLSTRPWAIGRSYMTRGLMNNGEWRTFENTLSPGYSSNKVCLHFIITADNNQDTQFEIGDFLIRDLTTIEDGG